MPRSRITRYFLDTEFIETPGRVQMISIGVAADDGRQFYAECDGVDWSLANDFVLTTVRPLLHGKTKPMRLVRNELVAFVSRGQGAPEFWAYFLTYDWFNVCQLFGGMMNIPPRFPQLCCELVQRSRDLGVRRQDWPKQTSTVHHALNDAKWNLEIARYLDDVAATRARH